MQLRNVYCSLAFHTVDYKLITLFISLSVCIKLRYGLHKIASGRKLVARL